MKRYKKVKRKSNKITIYLKQRNNVIRKIKILRKNLKKYLKLKRKIKNRCVWKFKEKIVKRVIKKVKKLIFKYKIFKIKKKIIRVEFKKNLLINTMNDIDKLFNSLISNYNSIKSKFKKYKYFRFVLTFSLKHKKEKLVNIFDNIGTGYYENISVNENYIFNDLREKTNNLFLKVKQSNSLYYLICIEFDIFYRRGF